MTAVLAGCPSRAGGGTAETLPKSSNPAATQRFQEARAKFHEGEYVAAAVDFEDFVREFPHDPLADTARLFAGRAAYELGDYPQAKKALEPIAIEGDEPYRRARYTLGLTYGKLSDWAAAERLLAPFAADTEGSESPAEINRVLSRAAEARGDFAAALIALDRVWPGAPGSERVEILERARALIAKLAADRVGAVYGALTKPGGVSGVVATRYAADLRAAGNPKRAAEVLHEAAGGSGTDQGTPPIPDTPGGVVMSRTVGLLLTTTGPQRAVAERALRGIALALGVAMAPVAGTPSALTLPTAATSQVVPITGRAGGYTILVRDSGGPDDVAARLEELVQAGASVIVGPIDKKSAAAAAARAEELGVALMPLTTFAGDVPPGFAFVVRPILSAEARAKALARRAKAVGSLRVAVFAPDSAYGKKLGEAFSAEARALGLEIAGTTTYPKDAVSFPKPVRELANAAKKFDTLFIPDTAKHLELIAPALAAADIWALPPGAKPLKGRRIQLLSTAEGLTADLLKNADRYVQGALLSPGFYADPYETAVLAYASNYKSAFGQEASLVDGASYDAGTLLRVEIERGTATAFALVSGIRAQTLRGVTGTFGFDEQGNRVDEGVTIQVAGALLRIARPLP